MPAPIVSPLMRSRPYTWLIAGFAVIQAALTFFHLPGLPCPLLKTTGIPCPGCGISRSVAAVIRGELHQALHLNPFGPVFAIAALPFIIASFLPATGRLRLTDVMEKLERRTGLPLLVLLAMMVYWFYRLAFEGQHFRELMAGGS